MKVLPIFQYVFEKKSELRIHPGDDEPKTLNSPRSHVTNIRPLGDEQVEVTLEMSANEYKNMLQSPLQRLIEA
ncbi:MAG: hypothetical protein QNJ31_00615 [Candidatus Caenarcaniphilales bacterium]|nr:hypothetical protein [Candidatus Caenarcaniphilales bacterium]